MINAKLKAFYNRDISFEPYYTNNTLMRELTYLQRHEIISSEVVEQLMPYNYIFQDGVFVHAELQDETSTV